MSTEVGAKSTSSLVAEFLSGAASGSGADPATVDSSAGSVVGTPDEDSSVLADDTQVSDSEGTLEAGGTAEKEPTQQTPDKELITITDDKGRRQVELDYTDRAAMKRNALLAHGSRKWQAERDQYKGQVENLTKELGDIRTNWDALEGAFRGKGIEGVIDLLEGKPGAYAAHIRKQVERAEFIRTASPEQLERLQEKEEAEREKAEAARLRQEFEELKTSVSKEKEQAQIHAAESLVNPTFGKYRFDGKLGDAETEAMFDEMLWNTTMRRLEPYDKQGLLTKELIDKEFRTVASAIRKRINVQAGKTADKVVAQRKQEATENVQSQVKAGYSKKDGAAQEAKDMIEQGNIKGLFKNWGRIGGAFGSK